MALAGGMKILVLNAGSSSLKSDVYEIDSDSARLLAGNGDAGVEAVGHRFVHGGERFHEPVVIDRSVEEQLEALATLAPLHNPASLAAYREARARLPDVPHVAVFDTAFHHTLPLQAYVYGLPYEYLARGIRRYGFHGISHQSVAARFPQYTRIISCHLGSGCSICAIDHGRSVDTSMGFTPLEGLLMGTRSGDIDPGAILHLIVQEKQTPEEVLRVLNHESGLKGLSGVSSDMREVLAAADGGHAQARLAVDAFCYRVKKYIGGYLAAMNGAEALIFTGGIGENSAAIRERICAGLDGLGIEVDAGANAGNGKGDRQIGFTRIPVWVAPAEEALMIARETARVLLPRSR